MDLTQPLPAIGAQIEGGYFAGLININGQCFGLVVAARDGGEAVDQAYLGEYREVPGATSVFDGQANTKALADAGSDLAKWATCGIDYPLIVSTASRLSDYGRWPSIQSAHHCISFLRSSMYRARW